MRLSVPRCWGTARSHAPGVAEQVVVTHVDDEALATGNKVMHAGPSVIIGSRRDQGAGIAAVRTRP